MLLNNLVLNCGGNKKPFVVMNSYKWEDKVVLIVEDDPSSLLLLETILMKTGATVLVAQNAHTAIDLTKSNSSIDLVLMDIRLKGINGLEATKIIKQIRPDMPVIAQTACTIIADMDTCLDAGCSAYITKPIKVSTLLSTMDYYFRKEMAEEMIENTVYSN